MVLDAPHRETSDITRGRAERTARRALDQERKGDMSVTDDACLPLSCRRERGEEDDDRRPVVEQRFARDHGFERCRQMHPLEQPLHGDRVRRGQNGAEHEAPCQRHVRPGDSKRGEGSEREQHGRHHHPDRRQAEHGPGLAPQLSQIDMQARRKQQQRQHAVEKDARKMGPLDPVLGEPP